MIYANPRALATPALPSDPADAWLGRYPILACDPGGVLHDVLAISPGAAGAYNLIGADPGTLQVDCWLDIRAYDPYVDPAAYRPLVVYGQGTPGLAMRPAWGTFFLPLSDPTNPGALMFYITDGASTEMFGPIPVGDGWSVGGGLFYLTIQVGSKDDPDASAIFIDGVERWRGTRTLNSKAVPSGQNLICVGSAITGAPSIVIREPIGDSSRIYYMRVLDHLQPAEVVAWEARGRAREGRWAVELHVPGFGCRARRWLRPSASGQVAGDLRAYVGDLGGVQPFQLMLRFGTPDVRMDSSHWGYIR
jgi:hypothetical protein